jgi:hypothetical protein
MRIICAWCLALIKAGDDGPGCKVSHGICKQCEAIWNADLAHNDIVAATNRRQANG